MSPVTPLPYFAFDPADIVLLGFYLLVGFYAIFTAVLYYHWRTYSPDVRMNLVTLVTYFVITIPLVITLATVTAII